jgi:hypothetical protein
VCDTSTPIEEIATTYGPTLSVNEFRLASLSAVPSDYPTQITLETFLDEDCPEYEYYRKPHIHREAKKGTALYADPFSLASIGMYRFKPRIAGQCFVSYVPGEAHEWSG